MKQGEYDMSLKHGLLGLLNYGSMSGYELDRAFKESLSFFWQAQTSQIYRELNAMERNGWLESERVIQDEKPNKRVYSLTLAGKEEFDRWLTNPEADIKAAMAVRSAFLMRVFFAGEVDDAQVHIMFRDFRKTSLEAAVQLQTVSKSIAEYAELVNNDERRTKYWKIAALFGEIYYRAEIEWAEKAISILGETV
ncbi:MAG: PadR family transcriptional regulator [Synergistaceae bacterium]|jgi:DNA-binding PadR family transcriptional regulator|nr:PadR family transcriptional regulator [Synergistaceae bacterium]